MTRALRMMALPERWHVSQLSRPGTEYMLFNSCSEESQLKRRWQESWDHLPFKNFTEGWPHIRDRAKEVSAKHQRYYDADELGRVEIDIEAVRSKASLAAMVGSKELARSFTESMSQLQAQRDGLIQTRASDTGGISADSDAAS